MADKKTKMDKVREAYVKAQANKDEDRLTQADLEKLKEAVKKNERKHISHNNEAKYYPNSKREPEKPIFDFRKKRPSPKIEPGKPPKEMPEQIKKYLEQKFQNDRSPTVTDTETGETTFGRPRKFEHGGMASCRGMGKAVKGGKFTGVK